MKKVRILAGALSALSFSGAGAALAHEKAHSASAPAISSEEKEFGRQGSPKETQRVIQIDMGDTMRFNPSSLTVKKGETIRFEVKNSGKLMHEMVLGTMAELKAR